LRELIAVLKPHYDLHMLSGDNESEKHKLADFFGNTTQLHFRQSPSNKLHYIEQLRAQNKQVMMLGDGLNDAGALKAAHTGVSITENTATLFAFF
jgi:Cu+-exporting ATPase